VTKTGKSDESEPQRGSMSLAYENIQPLSGLVVCIVSIPPVTQASPGVI